MPGLTSIISRGRRHSENTGVYQEGSGAAGKGTFDCLPPGLGLGRKPLPDT